MTRNLIGTGVLALLMGCVSPTKQTHSAEEGLYFAGRKGCFLLYNMTSNTFEKVIGEENCRLQLPACSTFKVPLSVIAFDSGVVKDENQIFEWDGIKSSREVSNQNHTARTWIRDSIVWFSQRITSQLGYKKLQKYLDAFDYGNRDLSAGITQAWLVSPGENKPALKISAYEQVEFMKKLWADTLPASQRSIRLTRELTFMETSPQGFKLSGKTGSNFYDKKQKIHLGWFISHLKKGGQEYIAVTNFSDLAPSDEPGYGGLKAKAMTKKILENQGLW